MHFSPKFMKYIFMNKFHNVMFILIHESKDKSKAYFPLQYLIYFNFLIHRINLATLLLVIITHGTLWTDVVMRGEWTERLLLFMRGL